VLSPKEILRKAYFHSRFSRWIARWLIRDERSPLDFSQILSIRELQIGPIHRDEAVFLFGLTRILRPRTIVEFGFMNGHSALNFLLAADPECQVFSYDITGRSEGIARRCFGRRHNFAFIRKSQADFSPEDIGNREIDLCFLDASHEFELNLKTFELIRPRLSDAAIVAVHDTGVWQQRFLKGEHRTFINSNAGQRTGRWIDAERYQPAVSERLFVNTLAQKCPEYSQIHFHSAFALRNGITLLQKAAPLITDPQPELVPQSTLAGVRGS
jgi:predicted O-methyltransferase YrrM